MAGAAEGEKAKAKTAARGRTRRFEAPRGAMTQKENKNKCARVCHACVAGSYLREASAICPKRANFDENAAI